MHSRSAYLGLSLIEVIVVLSILVALAAITVPRFDGLTRDSQITATRQTLVQLQDLILNRYVIDMNGQAASTNPAIANGLPGPDQNNALLSNRQSWPQLVFLFLNPNTADLTNTYNPLSGRGWRGSYLLSGRGGTYPGNDPSTAVTRGFTTQYGLNASQGLNGIADQAVLDTWGNPIVIDLDPTFSLTGVLPADYYQYTQAYRLISAGPDGYLNTTDDITIPLR